MRSGVTLLELLLALALSGLGLSVLVPAARRALDRFAVVSAREALAGRVASARLRAMAVGGARLVLDAPTATVWIEVDLAVSDSGPLEGPLPVEVKLTGTRSRIALPFDALGIGRVASQSIRFTRGRAASALVISAYGGVSRR